MRCRRGLPLLKRFHSFVSSRSHTPAFGIAFDIDGVLLRGKRPIGGAKEALRQLYYDPANPVKLRIPFILLTNGGGVTESAKAIELSQLLDVKISSQQVVLGHTPFKKLVEWYRHSHILALGKGEPINVMSNYGFQKTVSMDDYVLDFEEIDPLAKYKSWTKSRKENATQSLIEEGKKIDAVFVVSDPVDWGRDIQVLCDVLRSGGQPGNFSGQQLPLFFAADDFEYQGIFPVERLGMGAFRIALESIYNRLGSSFLEYKTFGKPKADAYLFAEKALQDTVFAMKTNNSLVDGLDVENGVINLNPGSKSATKFELIYMIGDNPRTDICGAREAGDQWFPILTRSGCFKGKGNDALNPANVVVNDVEEAVQFILARHML